MTTGPHARLWEIKHPYYCSEGCYYVNHTLGHRNERGQYDGNTCHADYASWSDFKAGKAMPLQAETLATRGAYGVEEPSAAEIKRQEDVFGARSFYKADDDYNLLYRWDWYESDPTDLDEDEAPQTRLNLFYMFQRKARPQSVSITVTRDNEPEIRTWLADKWRHMQRLWAPFAPDIQAGLEPEAVAERTMLFYGEISASRS